MAGKINLLGHPLHPILIVFPLGLLPTAVACDIIYLVRGNPSWAHISYWLIAGGVVSGIVAAFCGFMDWINLPVGTRARRLGVWHLVANDLLLICFAISWLMRRAAPDQPTTIAIAWAMVGLVCGVFGGWLGGELVYRLSVGVDAGAHINSPSSLSSRPASDNKETLPASQRG